MGILNKLLKNNDEFSDLVKQGTEELKAKTKGHQVGWGLGTYEKWDLNQDDGLLIFTHSNGIKAVCPAQIIGSFDSIDKTWMWSWANPSTNKNLMKDALKVKEYGEKHKIEKLTTPLWKATESDAWEMTALATKLCNAQGAYRGPAGTTYVFMTFGKVQLSKK